MVYVIFVILKQKQNWVKIISALKNYMNSREIKNIDINEITEKHIFLGIYEENSKESSVLNTIWY